MDFRFSDEENDFRSAIHDWVEDKCPKDVALELERHEDHDGTNFPRKLWDDMAEAGFFGIGIDEELGGQGGGAMIQSIFMEEVSRSLAGIAWIWGVNQFNTKSIQRFASEDLKQEFIPRLTEGKVITSIAVTEPGAGTDLLGGMITTAERDGDGFRINGAKIWSTMAHVSDYLLLLATTDKDAEKASRGKTLFLVDAKQDGVKARPIPKLGMRCVGSCEVQLDNAWVPDTHVIGEVNKGWGHILSTLNNERILVAAMCTGILRGVIEEAVQYAQERQAFGKPIGEFQVIQHWIADMQMRLMQSELLTYKASWLYDQDLPCGVESSAAKAIVSEYATEAADRGIQILGGMGYSAEYQMQRYWRDVRLYQIGPVTNQMVRNIVAESVGLPPLVLTAYPHVEAPLSLNGARLRNRITRTAHGTGLPSRGNVTEALIAFHEARARGGVGSVFTETCTVHPSSPGPLVAWRDDVVPGLAELAKRLHALDTCVFAQLWHGGIQAFPRDGSPAWAPSRLADPIHGRVSQPMTQAMIDTVVEGFAAAAARAERAGLDGVEVHGAHSYLVHSFLSPLTNARDDAYGADRIRFAREVLSAIRASTGPGFAVGIRIVGSEGVEGGIEPPEAVRIRATLEADGLVDFVDVSMGGYHALGKLIGAMHEPLGYELATSEPVTRGAGVPTIVTGRVTTLAQAEAILADGIADVVSMVRATIADPALVAKSLAGEADAVRPCIACNEGCVGRLFDSRPGGGRTGCSVNPDVGREGEPPPATAAAPRRVLVVGAGPAGLEAAWTAARRGHDVSIHEAADAPGGLLRVQRRAPYRDEIGRISDWLWDELGRLRVERRLDSRVDAELAGTYDAVVVATGSLPRRDGVQRLRPAQPVEGIERAVTPLEVLADEVPVPRTALVFDDCGNYEAVGAVELLLEAGAEVCLATSFDTIAPDLFRSFQHGALVARLGAHPGFRAITRAVLERIEPDRVTVGSLDGGPRVQVDAELAVVMTGFEPQTALVDELLAAGREVHPAGDAVAPLLLPHAIASGRAAGLAV